jgi:hypothetical protein
MLCTIKIEKGQRAANCLIMHWVAFRRLREYLIWVPIASAESAILSETLYLQT